MGYFYAGVWAIVAVYLFVMAFKESKFLLIVSGLFAFMSVWWLVNELLPVDLFAGMFGIIFRIVIGIVLVVLLIIYFMMKKRNISSK